VEWCFPGAEGLEKWGEVKEFILYMMNTFWGSSGQHISSDDVLINI
jgi:hypothetical protein